MEENIVATVRIMRYDPEANEMVYIISVPKYNGKSEIGGVCKTTDKIIINESDLK